MRVREREHRKEGKGHPAIGAATAPDPNPVVILVVGLLAAPAVTNDRIVFTETGIGVSWSRRSASAQSVAILSGATETGIKRTVASEGLRSQR